MLTGGDLDFIDLVQGVASKVQKGTAVQNTMLTFKLRKLGAGAVSQPKVADAGIVLYIHFISAISTMHWLAVTIIWLDRPCYHCFRCPLHEPPFCIWLFCFYCHLKQGLSLFYIVYNLRRLGRICGCLHIDLNNSGLTSLVFKPIRGGRSPKFLTILMKLDASTWGGDMYGDPVQ